MVRNKSRCKQGKADIQRMGKARRLDRMGDIEGIGRHGIEQSRKKRKRNNRTIQQESKRA
jgi:hypothetical protein